MTTFVQEHILIQYPPANLNRDNNGRPKTAVFGGTQRLRISSQSLKRSWRTSSVWKEHADESLQSIKTRQMGAYIYDALVSGNLITDLLAGKESESKNEPVDKALAEVITSNLITFLGTQGKDANTEEEEEGSEEGEESAKKRGKKGKKNVQPENEGDEAQEDVGKKFGAKELLALSSDEIIRLNACIRKISEGDELLIKILSIDRKKDDNKRLRTFRKNFQEMSGILSTTPASVDLAMFGRMLASNPGYGIEGAVQVAQAITVHKVAIEDDYFAAVDDLNKGGDMGSAHIGENEFASGLFYIYLCINRDLLKQNLGGNEEITRRAISALTDAALKVPPSGKQNTFAALPYAAYALVEKGTQQQRMLTDAFAEALSGSNLIDRAIEACKKTRDNITKVYGACCDAEMEINTRTGEGSLQEFLKFASE